MMVVLIVAVKLLKYYLPELQFKKHSGNVTIIAWQHQQRRWRKLKCI